MIPFMIMLAAANSSSASTTAVYSLDPTTSVNSLGNWWQNLSFDLMFTSAANTTAAYNAIVASIGRTLTVIDNFGNKATFVVSSAIDRSGAPFFVNAVTVNTSATPSYITGSGTPTATLSIPPAPVVNYLYFVNILNPGWSGTSFVDLSFANPSECTAFVSALTGKTGSNINVIDASGLKASGTLQNVTTNFDRAMVYISEPSFNVLAASGATPINSLQV